MFIEAVPATDAALCLYVVFDIDVRTAPTMTSAKVANHKDYTSRHIYFTRSKYQLRPSDPGTFSQCGIQETRSL